MVFPGLLSLVLFLPALGALAVLAMPSVAAIRWTSLAVTTVTFVLSLGLWMGFDPAVSTATAPQMADLVQWLPGLLGCREFGNAVRLIVT